MTQDRAAFAGQIADVPVVELLQTILQGRQTGIARFDTPSGAATLWFRDGALVDADMGRHHMESAVLRLLALEAGTFEVEFKPITRRQVIELGTAELIAQAPAPVVEPPPQEDTDPRGKRRRQGVSWHPTGGGKGREVISGAQPIVEMPSGPVPILAPPVEPAPVVAPMTFVPPPAVPPAEPVRSTDVTRGRTMFGIPSVGVASTPAPTPSDPPPSSTVVGAARIGLDATIPPLVASAAARMLDAGTPPVVDGPEAGDRTIMRPFAAPRPIGVDPTPVPREVPRTGEPAPISSAPEPPRGVTTTLFLPPPLPAPAPVAQWHDLPTTTERTSTVVPTTIQRGKTVVPIVDATASERTTDAAPDKTVVGAPKIGSTALVPVNGARPRLHDDRVADIAQAIGLRPLASNDPREAVDGVRLDQQVEAARAAGLTGASAPALVGRYEVLLRIARGGMGTVYLARITGEGGFRRLFALKVIRDHLSQNDEYVRMLLQEARIASRLHHPNVVGIVDIGTLANQHYLVMDYVEGCTFSELLKVHRRTRPAHLIVPVMIDALTGLHAAHTLTDDDGVPLTLVHCDFSPQNMLVGTNGICRITDFGIARATNALHERSSITRGKPAYVSPEQVVGRPVDRRSDVFSAGVVLWNALTGEQLFDGETPERTLHSVLNKPIPAPSTIGLRPPSCFDRVCLRALQRDPDRRYQSAEEMLIELRRIAIAEDYLAPSSEVAQWVIDTFGRQLELRRQAAGISNRGLGDSQPISVSTALAIPELQAIATMREQTLETNVLPNDYGTTPIDDGHASHTAMIRSDVEPAPLAQRTRAVLLAGAVALATIAIAIGVARPDWIRGGAVDEYGRYVPPDEDDGAPERAPKPDGETAKAPAPTKATLGGVLGKPEPEPKPLADPLPVPVPTPVEVQVPPPAIDPEPPATKPEKRPKRPKVAEAGTTDEPPKKPKKPKTPPTEPDPPADEPTPAGPPPAPDPKPSDAPPEKPKPPVDPFAESSKLPDPPG